MELLRALGMAGGVTSVVEVGLYRFFSEFCIKSTVQCLCKCEESIY